MVEKLKTIVTELKKANRPVWLFASLKMDDFLDRWSIIIAAPWFTEANRDTEYKNILDIMIRILTKEEQSSLALVAVLPKIDHLVEELLKRKTGDVIKEQKVNGNIVYEGYIIESNPELVWQTEGELFTKKT